MDPCRCSSASHPTRGAPGARTVGLEAGGFAVPAACLVDGLDEEDVAGATLEPVDGVVVLLDVGDDHPAVHGVVETCGVGEGRRVIRREGTSEQRTLEMERSWEPRDLEALLPKAADCAVSRVGWHGARRKALGGAATATSTAGVRATCRGKRMLRALGEKPALTPRARGSKRPAASTAACSSSGLSASSFGADIATQEHCFQQNRIKTRQLRRSSWGLLGSSRSGGKV